MDSLQDTLQSILSDPAQMEQIAAMARSLGVGAPPASGPPAAGVSPGGDPPGTAAAGEVNPVRASQSPPAAGQAQSPALPMAGMDLAGLMQRLSGLQGAEDRVFAALRPSLSAQGQRRMDRAARSAKLARLLGQFLQGKGGGGNV